MGLYITATSQDLALDYLPLLKTKLLVPLTMSGSSGIPQVIQLLESYSLNRNDWDMVQGVVKLSNMHHLLLPENINTAVKRKFTKACKDAGWGFKSAHIQKDLERDIEKVEQAKKITTARKNATTAAKRLKNKHKRKKPAT